LGLEHVVGESPAFVALIKQIPLMAKYDVSLLILGETGTGKEVFARAIHYHSSRADKPFIPVNCGAIPVELLENEFFGHESGAFTSANSSRRGVIKEADGGTLFLDEVDCLPSVAQVKLLRFLQDGQFRPLGSASVCTADVRHHRGLERQFRGGASVRPIPQRPLLPFERALAQPTALTGEGGRHRLAGATFFGQIYGQV